MDYLPNQFRKDLITEAVIYEQFPAQRAYMLFGLLESLESGASLVEAVSSLETQYATDENVLETLDLASTWVRENQKQLQLYID
jgi:hypothetical protein